MQLVDEPCEHKAERIAQRACENCEDKSCSDGFDENIVLNKKGIEIVKSNKFWRKMRHIEVGEAHRQRHDNRNNGEHDKEDHKRCDHTVASDISPHFMECILEILLKSVFLFTSEQNFFFLGLFSQR